MSPRGTLGNNSYVDTEVQTFCWFCPEGRDFAFVKDLAIQSWLEMGITLSVTSGDLLVLF